MTKQKWLIRIGASAVFLMLLVAGSISFVYLSVASAYQTGLADVLLFGSLLFFVVLIQIGVAATIVRGQLPALRVSIKALLIVVFSYAVWLWLIL